MVCRTLLNLFAHSRWTTPGRGRLPLLHHPIDPPRRPNLPLINLLYNLLCDCTRIMLCFDLPRFPRFPRLRRILNLLSLILKINPRQIPRIIRYISVRLFPSNAGEDITKSAPSGLDLAEELAHTAGTGLLEGWHFEGVVVGAGLELGAGLLG